MDRTSLVGQIRFQLGRLKSLNKHHEFERLALAFARTRVAANLIPATGPVGAGGDQGRDFESFRTNRAQLPLAGAFADAASDDDIAGTCTLQSSDSLPSKVRADLKNIFATEPKPTRVLFFCAEGLPIGKRHRLEKECRETYGATLTVFDGEALSEHLADKDIFWIAVEFLDIPSDFFPDEYEDAEYRRIFEKWLTGAQPVQNYADFVEIKRGVRTSTFEDAVKADLTAWIGVMRRFVDNGYPPALEQKARYEVCVAELRGHGSMDPALPLLERFLGLTDSDAFPSALNDAAVLLVYAWGAAQIGQASITREYVVLHRKRLLQIISEALATTTLDVDRCTLLEARAMLSATATAIDGPNESTRKETFQTWGALVDAAKLAPLYPVIRLGSIFELMTSLHGSNREFRSLAATVDGLITERTGGHDSGDRARKRALIHIEAGNHLAAVDELQRVKTSYYSGETIDGAVLAMLLLSEQYEQLHLHIAARYLAASALYIASREEKAFRLVSKAAFRVAQTFYAAGEGLSSVYCAGLALDVHEKTTSDSENWEKHQHVQIGVYHSEVYRAISKRLAPELLGNVDSAFATWPIDPHYLEPLRQSSDNAFGGMGIANVENRIEEQLGVSPFLDIGIRTSYEWTALGIRWTVEHGPNEDERFAALDFVSTLQILQADLADEDLVLVPSNVKLHLTRGDVPTPKMDPVPGNNDLAWNVMMPRSHDSMDVREAGVHVMAVAVVVLRATSVMSDEAFDGLLRERMECGLPGRALFVRPARELLAMVQPTLPPEVASMARPTLSRDISPAGSTEMIPSALPGPGYSTEKARKLIATRYKYGPPSIKLTLPRLLLDLRTRELIAGLRVSGLLDWQILLVVCNIVVQWQIEKQLGRPTSRGTLRAIQLAAKERMMRDEREDDPEFDLLAFDSQAISAQQITIIMLALQSWGLQNHRQMPDFEAIKTLLSLRYGFLRDDVEHDNPFPDV